MDFSQHGGGGTGGGGGLTGGGGGIRGARSSSSSNSSSGGGLLRGSVGPPEPSSPSTSQYLVHSPFSPKNELVGPYQSSPGAASPLPGGPPLGFPRSPASPLMSSSSIKCEPPVSPGGGMECSLPTKKGRYDGSSGSGAGDWGSRAPSPSMMIDSPDPGSSNGASGFGAPVMSPMSSSSLGDPSSPFPRTGDFGRDDISPSGSNGFMDNYSIDLKKKKGPVPRQAEELCLVCGDRASGYHYNALTCEGCKGFFRRSITKNAVYRCKYGDNCEMDMYMRRKCQECRLKKCLNVGMRPECVVPEYQCQVKREQKKAREKDKKPDICDLGSPIVEETKSMLSPQSSYEDSLGGFPKPKLAPLPVNLNPAPKNGVKPLSREQEELIQTLVYYQEEYEQPSEEDLKKITFSFDTEDTSDMRFKHITEMTILTVQLIVEFSKRLPGFDTLQREDQITLLKACSSEVMMLRAARRYDANTDSIVFGNSYPYTQDSYDMAGLGDSADVLFRFCRNLCKMKVDNAEYALLAAIAIFSERPQLVELRKVEKLQEIYLDALKAYVENRRTPQSTLVFAKLLNVLTELRTLGNINAEVCFSLTVKNKKLPPFLAEIWDVHQC